jgi:hypothetical protein
MTTSPNLIPDTAAEGKGMRPIPRSEELYMTYYLVVRMSVPLTQYDAASM